MFSIVHQPFGGHNGTTYRTMDSIAIVVSASIPEPERFVQAETFDLALDTVMETRGSQYLWPFHGAFPDPVINPIPGAIVVWWCVIMDEPPFTRMRKDVNAMLHGLPTTRRHYNIEAATTYASTNMWLLCEQKARKGAKITLDRKLRHLIISASETGLYPSFATAMSRAAEIANENNWQHWRANVIMHPAPEEKFHIWDMSFATDDPFTGNTVSSMWRATNDPWREYRIANGGRPVFEKK